MDPTEVLQTPVWVECIVTLDPHTSNINSNSNYLSIIKTIEYIYKNIKRPAERWADGPIYYTSTQGI